MRQLAKLLPLVAVVALTGCGDRSADSPQSSGPRSPEAAVRRFLDVMSQPAAASASDAGRRELWRRACDAVEPRLRTLRFDDSDTDTHANCGAAVTLLALGTGENSGVPSASGITGSVCTSRTTEAESIVTVTVRYLRANEAAGTADVRSLKVLAVKRSGAWWLATPQALNPAITSRGGLTDAQLRAEYRKLLRAAGH